MSGRNRNGSFNVPDFCFSSKWLEEAFCSSSRGDPRTTIIDCEGYFRNSTGVCTNGACVQRRDNETCTDSDGGINYFVKGTARRGSNYATDFCMSNITLKEYYCSFNNIGSVNQSCSVFYNNRTNSSMICFDGACK
ncbi:MAG: hypothetical protein AABY07_05065 [Nanoarchaeota archaeon]